MEQLRRVHSVLHWILGRLRKHLAIPLFGLRKWRRYDYASLSSTATHGCFTGAFLIPYWCSVLLAGLPFYFLELALGQYSSLGANCIFTNLAPIFQGEKAFRGLRPKKDIPYCRPGMGYGSDIFSGIPLLQHDRRMGPVLFGGLFSSEASMGILHE